jgi:multidrug resistance efflux pump
MTLIVTEGERLAHKEEGMANQDHPPRIAGPARPRVRRRYLLALFLAAAAGMGALRAPAVLPAAAPGDDDSDRYCTARRGDFRITVPAQGHIHAVRYCTLSFAPMAMESAPTVVFVVPDRTPVKKGDVVIRLAAESERLRLDRMRETLAELDDAHSEKMAAMTTQFQQSRSWKEGTFKSTKTGFLSRMEALEIDYQRQRVDLQRMLGERREEDHKALGASRTALAANLNAVKDAALAVRSAISQRERYRSKGARAGRAGLIDAIETADAGIEAARREVTGAEQMLAGEQNYASTEYAQLEAAVARARTGVDSAQARADAARRVLREHRQRTHPEKVRELDSAVTTAQLELAEAISAVKKQEFDDRRAQRQRRVAINRLERQLKDLAATHETRRQKEIKSFVAATRSYHDDLVKLEANYNANHARTTRRHNRRKDGTQAMVNALSSDLEKLELVAPVDGLVKLHALGSGGDDFGGDFDEPTALRVGARVGPHKTLASIPDLSRFVIRADIPEAHRSRLRISQPAVVRSPALPDLKMAAKVSAIAPMAHSRYDWTEDGPKVYSTCLETETTDSRLMPGMTVELELLVELVTDAIHVPVEAIVRRDQHLCCQVLVGNEIVERKVEVGRRSAHRVEVVSGLQVGERVRLYTAADESR